MKELNRLEVGLEGDSERQLMMLRASRIHLLADVHRVRVKKRALMNQASCCLDHLGGDIERMLLMLVNHPLHLETDHHLIGGIDGHLMNLANHQRVFRLQGSSPKSDTEKESAK